jgi:hypothetical protein
MPGFADSFWSSDYAAGMLKIKSASADLRNVLAALKLDM